MGGVGATPAEAVRLRNQAVEEARQLAGRPGAGSYEANKVQQLLDRADHFGRIARAEEDGRREGRKQMLRMLSNESSHPRRSAAAKSRGGVGRVRIWNSSPRSG